MIHAPLIPEFRANTVNDWPTQECFHERPSDNSGSVFSFLQTNDFL